MTRPNWNSYFMKIAQTIAQRSTCDRANVGAVLVKDKRILTTEFNGSPSGLPHCDEVGHLLIDNHCQRAVHAEANAIIQAALHGISTAGASCYVTHYPCFICCKLLINAGISEIFYDQKYRLDENTRLFLEQSGIITTQLFRD